MGNWTWKTDILEPVSWLNLFNNRSFEAFAVKPLHQILLFIEFWHMRGISSRNITKHRQHCRQRTWIWGLVHWENIVPDIPMERTNSLSIHILKQTNLKSIRSSTTQGSSYGHQENIACQFMLLLASPTMAKRQYTEKKQAKNQEASGRVEEAWKKPQKSQEVTSVE